MFKKIAIGTVLVSTILFGSGFSQDVQAQTNYTKHVYYQYSGNHISNSSIQEMLNKWLAKYPQAKVELKDNQGQETAKQEETTQKQPVEQKETTQKETVKEPAAQPEQPAKQETAKENTTKKDQAASELSQFEQQVVTLTNQERQKHGLAALKVDTELSKVARAKSQDMASNGYFSHNSPTYGSPFDMMKQFGINYKTAGENIAKGQQTPQEVVNAWMNSEGHRANILNANFTHIGVGFVENGNVWTQQFIGK
ncbi:sporulation protein [Gracilibacillus oryzae]|uniref:Sporulation protein n=1 Tax=Gracilibacillus oryzae TaxID=1672701 RepID=A0A7C8L7Z1_9BACI|nr:CAP domain-containing protein [Gracilibacillus oryzae]KAB8137819.1 sporulation protein [Gracilibacillus oryzae]